jgi:hypothetical protein
LLRLLRQRVHIRPVYDLKEGPADRRRHRWRGPHPGNSVLVRDYPTSVRHYTPPAILAPTARRYTVRGLTFGAVKG